MKAVTVEMIYKGGHQESFELESVSDEGLDKLIESLTRDEGIVTINISDTMLIVNLSNLMHTTIRVI